MDLFTPDFGLIFWMFVSFAILFLILWKWGWPVILKSVDARADLIDKGVEYAQNAKEQLDNARQTADQVLAEARRQQADMMQETARLRAQLVEQAKADASAEAAKVKEAAQTSIDQARKEAEHSLRRQIGNYALDIASRVVRDQLKDKEAQARLADSLLDEIEKKN